MRVVERCDADSRCTDWSGSLRCGDDGGLANRGRELCQAKDGPAADRKRPYVTQSGGQNGRDGGYPAASAQRQMKASALVLSGPEGLALRVVGCEKLVLLDRPLEELTRPRGSLDNVREGSRHCDPAELAWVPA